MSQENVELLRSLYTDGAEGNFWTTGDYVDPEIELEWVGTSLAEIGNPAGEGRMHGLHQLGTAWRDWLRSWGEAHDRGPRVHRTRRRSGPRPLPSPG